MTEKIIIKKFGKGFIVTSCNNRSIGMKKSELIKFIIDEM